MEYHIKAEKKSRFLPSRPLNSPAMHNVQKEVVQPLPVLKSHLLGSRRAALAADRADCEVTDLHIHGEGGRELHLSPVGVGRGHRVGEAVDRATDEAATLLDDLLRVVPGTTALSRIGRGGASDGRGRGSAGAGGSAHVARRSSSSGGGRRGGTSEGRGVVVGANAALDHVDGDEALVAIEAETSDGGLNALEQLAAILRLLVVVRAREVELVAAYMVVPHEGTSGRNAGGRVAHAVLVAAVLVADLLLGELQAEDVVEDGAAVGPSGVFVVCGQDMEGVALVEVPLVSHGGRIGCCDAALTIKSLFVACQQWKELTISGCMICRCRKI